jgi:UDP:flavonoid glycosyltransferase YjiC (YdhE family)
VRAVLYEPGYRAAAQRLSATLAAAPGAPRAAELLERLAESGEAIASSPPITVDGARR